MPETTSEGKCSICEKTYSRRGMARHLKSCVGQKLKADKKTAKSGAGEVDGILVSVEGHYLPRYWLYLETPLESTLEELDEFLRKTWLECCGHMSAFEIYSETFSKAPSSDWDEKDMEFTMHGVLNTGDRFSYEYDFGSTTKLNLKIVGLTKKYYPDQTIGILARNIAPTYRCDHCSKNAEWICQDYETGDTSLLCTNCVKESQYDEEMLLPLVNSPRAGVCGYCG